MLMFFLLGGRFASAQIHQMVCDSMVWYGTTYTQSGHYTHGNDELYLTVIHSSHTTETVVGCDHFTWRNGVTYYANNTEATYILTNAQGCDSVIHLDLTIKHNTTHDETVEACDSYTWHGTTYTHSTDSAAYTIPNSQGCDSIISLHLTIRHSFRTIERAWSCDKYTWQRNGQTYYESTYTEADTLQSALGCDSIIVLYLTINHNTTADERINTCGPITWRNGVTYTENVTASDSITYRYHPNHLGCDSIIRLILNVHSVDTGYSTMEVCGDFAMIDTNTYHITNAQGCDSVVVLQIIVHPNTYADVYDTACDRYTWINQVTYRDTTVDRHVIPNAADCDSILTLHLIIHKSVTVPFDTTVCNSIEWYGNTYNGNGTFSHYDKTVLNCDSIEQLRLTVVDTTFRAFYMHTCEPYHWHAQDYSTPGTYDYTYSDATGCLHTERLFLTTGQRPDSAFYISECDEYNWMGLELTSDTSVVYNYMAEGSLCTMVDTLYLTIRHSSHHTDSIEACNQYTWTEGDGQTYSQAINNQRFFSTNSVACDSVVTLHLRLHRRGAIGKIDAMACDSLLWHDTLGTDPDSYRYYTQSGVYTFDTISLPAYGSTPACDSTIQLTLIVFPTSHQTEYETACDSFFWDRTDSLFTLSTTSVADTLINRFGCDSLIHLNLTVNYSGSHYDTVTACDSYVWQGGTCYESNSYTYRTTTTKGCDSNMTLMLLVNHSTSSDTSVTVCDSLSWLNGVTYYASVEGLRYKTTNAVGCDSVITLNLTVNHGSLTKYSVHACDYYFFEGDSLSESGFYDYTALTENHCDSIRRLELFIHHPDTSATALTICDSIVWVDGNTYSEQADSIPVHLSSRYGCDSLVYLSLTVHHSSSTSFTDSVRYDSVYYWPTSGLTYTDPGTYYYEYISPENCPSVDTLYLLRDHFRIRYHMIGEVNDPNMGYIVVFPDTLMPEGDTVYFIAVPHEGYKFMIWYGTNEDPENPVQSCVVGTQDIRYKGYFIRNLGIDGVDGINFGVSPNPSNGHVTVSIEGTDLRKVEVYDLQGRSVYKGGPDIHHDLSHLSSGTYIFRAETPRGQLLQRIIISK